MAEYRTLEINIRFDLLRKYERRCIIHVLQETEDGHATLSDVVSHLAKRDPTPSDPDPIETTLHHAHLPKLTSIDAIEFGSRSEIVRYYDDERIDDLTGITPETHIPGP